MSKKTILFVDDEPFVLSGLRRMCYPLRNNWDFIFAGSGIEAIKILENNDISILISDMRMPGINGLELFSIVQCRFPWVVRILLTGQTDKEMYGSAMFTSHYFLSKPADFKCLSMLLFNINNIAMYLNDKKIIEFIHKTIYLPSHRDVLYRLVNMFNDEIIENKSIVNLINKDISLSAQVLKFVNTSHFNISRRVVNIDEAVSLLGKDILGQLVENNNIFSQFTDDEYSKFGIDLLWKRSCETAVMSKKLAAAWSSDVSTKDDAYIAGLLLEIGKLILMRYSPDGYGNVLREVDRQKRREVEVEKELFGADHAAVGAYLVSLWGLPSTIAEAVGTGSHECFSSEDVEKMPLVSRAVYMASQMSRGNELAGADVLGGKIY